MNITKVDRLFVLGALQKRVKEELDVLRGECADELEKAYLEEGTTQRRSPYFGKEAGTLSIAFSSARPEREEVTYVLKDMTALAKWCNENRLDVEVYIQANASQFASWLVEYSGELPEGIERIVSTIEAQPEKPCGVRLSVKPEHVFEKFSLQEVDQLLLGDSND